MEGTRINKIGEGEVNDGSEALSRSGGGVGIGDVKCGASSTSDHLEPLVKIYGNFELHQELLSTRAMFYCSKETVRKLDHNQSLRKM